jgi:hypothetical protein
MAILEPNPIFNSLSGTIGDSVVIRRVGKRSYLSAKPSRRRKRDKKKRSGLQEESSAKFKRAAYFSKFAIKTPEIHAYFKQMAVAMGGTNNAYTALISYYKKTPDLTYEKVLEMVRTAIPEESKNPEQGLEFSITGPNGDTIAHGIAVSAGKGQWTYTAPFTGVHVIISDRC